MSLLDTVKLGTTLIVMAVVGLCVVNPAFNFGVFLGGVTLGAYMLLILKDVS